MLFNAMKGTFWAIGVFALGLWVLQGESTAWKEKNLAVEWALMDVRNPAALSPDSNPQLSTPITAEWSKRQMLAGLQVRIQQEQIVVELSNFIIQAPNGGKYLACGYYDQIRLRFVGEGIAESGHRPEMLVESPCSVGTRLNKLEPIWIQQAHFGGPNRTVSQVNQGPRAYFIHPSTVLPETWVLNSIEMYRSASPEEPFLVSSKEIDELLARKITLTCPPTICRVAASGYGPAAAPGHGQRQEEETALSHHNTEFDESTDDRAGSSF